MCVHVVDVEVHEELRSLKNGKYTRFHMAMNLFLLAVSSSIFGHVSEAVLGECLKPERE